jgi:hypothetical protein
MTASVLSTPGTLSPGALSRAGSALHRQGPRRQVPQRRARDTAMSRPQRLSAAPGAPLAVAAALVLLAVLLAPEQPQVQEAICHRHSGVAACRVW